MDALKIITDGATSIGIELGSTRIKAVLIARDFSILAEGVYDWSNKFENGVWTYSLDDVNIGLRGCFTDLMANVKSKYGIELKTTASIGVSAMMHGYLAFGANDELLVPFRTWRNTMTLEAADKLTEAFHFNIPQRWSIAHLYQAILSGEAHVPQIRFLTTLAGYVHTKLTGKKVLGIGDASGMFPIDPKTMSYDAGMLDAFASLTAGTPFTQNLLELLPEIVPVGDFAGTLSEEGALLLDPTGTFRAGVSLCPPEGDAQTGMVATNSIAPRTGNVSAGTSIFGMVVLEKPLSKEYRQIDIVNTPCGSPAAMVHCNNCTTELNAWVNLLGETLELFDKPVSKGELYDKLFTSALDADADCGGIVGCNYHSGEHVTGFSKGMPLLQHSPDGSFTIGNLMRSLIYSSIATLKIGMDILLDEEKIRLDRIYAHGGLFKTPVVGQRFLSSALGVPVELMTSAGEGGAWGIAILAAYQARAFREETLGEYLSKHVFTVMSGTIMEPDEENIKSFSDYTKAFKQVLKTEKAAITQ